MLKLLKLTLENDLTVAFVAVIKLFFYKAFKNSKETREKKEKV